MDPQTPVEPTLAEEQNQPITTEESSDIRQQVVERLNSSKNVLVTVNANPTVDELASVLGLTMVLNKLSKHVTAVFSGKIPSAMQFLDPETTFENNVDSLRDFIIALDKEKADKLRYKVEDDVVKVFITPYQTVITEKDLQFSQGDFNVDVIIALGALKGEALDSAISAQGNIMHNAEIITITAGVQSGLGSIDWNSPDSSSIAEMLVGLTDSLGESLIDESVGTAFLTGLVAETNRFSNEKTTPTVMRIAAQLMAAGANQQLVATNLRQEGMISESIRAKRPSESDSSDDNGEMVLNHQKQSPQNSKNNPNQNSGGRNKGKPQNTSQNQQSGKRDGRNRSFNGNKPIAQAQSLSQPAKANFVAPQKQPDKVESEQQANSANKSDAAELPKINSVKSSGLQTNSAETINHPEFSKPVFKAPDVKPFEIQPPVDEEAQGVDNMPQQTQDGLPIINPQKSASITEPPRFGGTLNATVAEPEDQLPALRDQSNEPEGQLFEHNKQPTYSQQDSDEAVAAARRAIEDAVIEPGSAENQLTPTLQAIAQSPEPLVVDSNASANQAASLPPAPVVSGPVETTPVEDFMQPHAMNNFSPSTMNMQTVNSHPDPGQASVPGSLPPLPPMPGGAFDTGVMPPLPLPGQTMDSAASFAPQVNPGFMESVNQSQNTLTDAGQDVSSRYADAESARQTKLDEIAGQYDVAVGKNRELQGLPPVQDHATFPLPPQS